MKEVLDRVHPPRIKDAIEFNLELKPAQHFTLDNGVAVYAVDAGAEEVLQMEWVFYAGNWFEDKNLLAASTNFLLKNGTKNKTAYQVNEHFEYFGSYLNRSCFNETSTVTLHCLNKHVGELLPVMREILTESVFPEEELNIYKQNMQQRLRVNLKKCDFVASRLIDSSVYGEEHPYGRYSHFEDFAAINRDDILNFYEKYYTRGKFLMFVAGKLPVDLQSLLNRYFGDLPLNEVQIAPVSVRPAEEKKLRITNDAAGVQGAIRMASPFPNRHHPDFIKTQVLNNLFGGFFGSRLMSNIREDKGYTYGIYSYLENHLQDTAWVISTEAGRDVCEATIEEVYKEMNTLREEIVEADELLLVKNYMLGSILGDLDGPFHIINRWKNIILHGLTKDYFDTQIKTIKDVTAEELQALANKYLQPDHFYELVVV
ncbi:MAG: M16 family metallopeptidase [Flavisolibacter sp.]